MQLELFPHDELDGQTIKRLLGQVRNHYWTIRNTRAARFAHGRQRRAYRDVSTIKKTLRMAGFTKRQILDFLSCCRNGCSGKKDTPFCRYCFD